ncbi:DUF1971 domain-containing protein [Novosphingobium album (ex Liu et al. 2023)]|uniref:DUF1971 domain-containing protein n=1 Tax=Novosphingobium album (ex Liu et al. 2023) TaxID=3031130 RepID=A0ABT5WKQ6_9SPHN|nr:DUF1971 domain-containing protein [Novosphingobium album (ex Liu et al. 2023)]MDE8650629.1 DUF1971 domain-containing protein [Novosphingobium album (ex Liu et al. 2023)]
MAEPYRSTPIFDENTLPQALRSNHQTKEGVWGVIKVLEGVLNLTYVQPHAEKELTPGNPGLVAPQQTHFVTTIGPMRMQVDFYNEPPTF